MRRTVYVCRSSITRTTSGTGRVDFFVLSHDFGIVLSQYLSPFCSQYFAYVVLEPLRILFDAFIKQRRTSSSGCCARIRRCLVLSSLVQSPLVSTIIPFGRIKSGVYVDSFLYSIFTVSYPNLTPFRSNQLAVFASNPERYLEVRRQGRFLFGFLGIRFWLIESILECFSSVCVSTFFCGESIGCCFLTCSNSR